MSVDDAPVRPAAEASDGNLTASLSTAHIAAGTGDTVFVNGTASGSDSVRVYAVGPRGRFYGTTDDVTGSGPAEFDTDADGAFTAGFTVFDRRGEWAFVVVATGADDAFADNGNLDHTSLPGEYTQRQAVFLALDEHTGSGTDDQVVELSLDAEIPRLTITDFTTMGEVSQAEVTVSGESNRADGTTVDVEVLEDGVDVVAESNGTVDAGQGRWSGTVDLSDVETGGYTLYVDDGESTASMRFFLVEEASAATPAETPVDDAPSATETASASEQMDDVTGKVLDNATGALEQAENETGRDLPNPAENGTNETNAANESVSETTESEGDGFGVGVGVAALVAAVAVAARAARE